MVTDVQFAQLARDYAARYPRPNTGEASWDQMCGNLMFRFGAYTTAGWNPRVSGPTAWTVAQNSGLLNGDSSQAPAGAIHWWKSGAGGHPGHTAVDLHGGGRYTFMATWAVAERLGEAIGIQSVTGYSNAKPFMLYQGWTRSYAGAVFGGGIAQSGSIDAPELKRKRFKNMWLIYNTAGTGFLMGETGKRVGFPNAYHFSLVARMFENKDVVSITFNAAEIDIISSYLRAVAPDVTPAAAATVDAAKLAAELVKAGLTVKSGIDDATIAKVASAVDASLIDNFAGIPGAVNLDLSKRLQA